MSGVDTRHIARDSLFLMANIRLPDRTDEYRVKVRNLSAAGMMAEGTFRAVLGNLIEINLRNIGWVEGSVAWVQDNRFGIAFSEEIDPGLARARPRSADLDTPRFTRPSSILPPGAMDPSRIRKI